MTPLKRIKSNLSFIKRYHFRWVLAIAIVWTVADVIYWVRFMHLTPEVNNRTVFEFLSIKAILLRCTIVFFMSGLMGYILIFKLRQIFRDYPLFLNLLIKTTILLGASLIMNFLLHVTYSIFVLNFTLLHGLHRFFGHAKSLIWLIQHSVGWVGLFLITQITIEINEKYAPGVFWAILIGRYIQPKVEKRIVMFMDLRDSTPIAEKLGSTQNFKFIRDFIYYVSISLLEYDGRIYQYVGDEIVVSWLFTRQNVIKCLEALTLSSKMIKRRSNYFQSHYGFVPEFRAGVHVGIVTVGEIGIVKKDIAMSGDTMNTTARIRTACSELERKYIASKEFVDNINSVWQIESLGLFDLKGKTEKTALYEIKI